LAYACPQSRDRVYFFGIRQNDDIYADMCDKEAQHDADQEIEEEGEEKIKFKYKGPEWWTDIPVMMKTVEHPSWDMQDFLLPPGHDDIEAWREERWADRAKEQATEQAQKDKSKKDKGERTTMEFHVDHLQSYEKAGLEWPPALPEDFVGAHFPRRSKEIVWYLVNVFPLTKFPFESAHDLHLNIKWQKGPESDLNRYFPCLVATSRPWLRIAGRDLTGSEAL
jgi:site-specific DNA-cytosine methylase